MAESPSSQELLQLANEFEKELTGNILPYWIKHAPNHKTTGFYGEVSADDVPNPDAARGALLSSRILWMFSSAYIHYKNPEYLRVADLAFHDLESTFWDRQHGGLYWTVSSTGESQEARKQIYGQVFGIYGYSEYFRASGERAALERAKVIFELVEEHALDRENAGYVESLARDWKPLVGRVENPVADTEKSQNTHLHVMEAYTNLLRAWEDEGSEKLRSQLRKLLDVMFTRVLDQKTNHLALFLHRDWQVEGDGISFGHDIEAAWLFLEAAEVLEDAELIEKTRDLAVKIANVTMAQGLDADGGVFQEASATQGLMMTDKDWWVQAEAVVGFLNAFEISGSVKYFEAAMKTWEFVKRKLIKEGAREWHWGTDKDGKILIQPTISLWKCPYHNGRAMIEGSQRLRRVAG